jgi:hypothetical protein
VKGGSLADQLDGSPQHPARQRSSWRLRILCSCYCPRLVLGTPLCRNALWEAPLERSRTMPFRWAPWTARAHWLA